MLVKYASMRLFLLFLLCLSLCAVTACSTRGSDGRTGPGTGTDAGSTGDAGNGTDSGPYFPGFDAGPIPSTDDCQKMDILVIVDDSGSMGEEQANLATNFPRFVEVLDAFRTSAGTELDYRIAVTTTGVDFEQLFIIEGAPPPLNMMNVGGEGPDGEFIMGCGLDRRWIERSDPDVTGTFSCLANVGTSGSGTEMPLKALNLAITDRVTEGTNAGFLREDALLAVVVLTDEDDCSHREDSAEPVVFDLTGGFPDFDALADTCDPEADTIFPIADLIANVDAVKGDRGRWAVSVIAGPGPGTCESSFGTAQEATRLKSFLEQVGENTSFSSICEGDLAAGLMNAIDTFDAACEAFPPLI